MDDYSGISGARIRSCPRSAQALLIDCTDARRGIKKRGGGYRTDQQGAPDRSTPLLRAMTTWHWIRHGPTHATSFVGWRDLPADVSDTARITRLQTYLPEDAVLVSSDLLRAVQTADALDKPDRPRLPHDPHLREMNFGLWDGMQSDAITASYPTLSRKFWEDPGDVAAPCGESWNSTSARVELAVRSISQRHAGKHIIAVAHFGVILTQVQRALNISARDTLSHRIENLSVTRIERTAQGNNLQTLNHLP